ncbi:hypothetical protein [uncultured Nevskia sp.]|uniref:hypothetical protein n=1 Tax=uncultured Nevskia sp. TaxID=228950 RepID=UPI0025EC4335|nr:hypothetical protein [uncultured Nevskia sp.]
MKTILRLLATLCLSTSLVSQAHEGHDHDEDEAVVAAPAAVNGARLSLATPRVELVAVRAADGALNIYADDYASNAPLAGVALHVGIGSRSLQAADVAPGSWLIPAALLTDDDQPLTHFELRGNGWTETLEGPLPAKPVATAASETRSGGGLVLLLLPLLAVLALQRRSAPERG